MSAHKHTPGPWVVVTENVPNHAGGTNTMRTIHTEYDHPQLKGKFPIVTLSFGLNPNKSPHTICYISEANARLIAAAPDMYDALLKALDFLVPQKYRESEYNNIKNVWLQARAAIAKATGETKGQP